MLKILHQVENREKDIFSFVNKNLTLKGFCMKIVSSLKSRKKGRGNQLVRRKGRIYVINKKNPKAKARQGG